MVFISGEYKGLKSNYDRTVKATKYLYENYRVFEGECMVSGIFSLPHSYDELPYEEGLQHCLRLLEKCSSVVFLSGCEHSVGSKIEYEYLENLPWIEKYYFDVENKNLFYVDKQNNVELIMKK